MSSQNFCYRLRVYASQSIGQNYDRLNFHIHFFVGANMIKHFFMPVLALTVVSLAYVVLPPAVTAQTIPTTTIPTSVTRVMITNATTASPYLVITPGAG